MLALWVKLENKKNIKYLTVILKLCTRLWNAVNTCELLDSNWTALIYIRWSADSTFHIYVISLRYITVIIQKENKEYQDEIDDSH